MSLSQDLLEILRCPESGARLALDGETLISTSPDSRRAYKIVDGVSNLIVEEGEVLEPEAWAARLAALGVTPKNDG